jgi:anti-sigma regulatory factor (Ser/Thr protein kinase)
MSHPELLALRERFMARLPQRLADMHALLPLSRQAHPLSLASLQRHTHNLVGAAGMHGLDAVVSTASELDNALRDRTPSDAAAALDMLWPLLAQSVEGALSSSSCATPSRLAWHQQVWQMWTYPNQLSSLLALRREFEAFIQNHPLPEELIDRVTLVLVEVFSNVVRHGLPQATQPGQHHVGLLLGWSQVDELVAVMSSEGPDFSPPSGIGSPDALLSEDGGYGLAIIHSCCGEVRFYNHEGMNLCAMRWRNGPEGWL